MKIVELSDLEPVEIRAVVINVRTELVTTQAIASLRKHAECRVLLINCEPTPESELYFDELAKQWDFDILPWPARPHGDALDQLFLESKDKFLLLVDSDAELTNDRIFVRILSDLCSNELVFGAGFVHGPGWLSDKEKVGDGNALYQARPWIPCVGLRVEHVREAINRGISFKDRTVRHEVELHLLRFAESDVDALFIDAIYCDTGADIYMWNVYAKGRYFLGPEVHFNNDVNHYHGVTRLFLTPGQTNGVRLEEISREINDRLKGIYDFDFPAFVTSLSTASNA